MVGGLVGLVAFILLAVRALTYARLQPQRRSLWNREAVLFIVLAVIIAACLAYPFVVGR
jgi:uncharacterized membrane protein SirB2